MRWNRRGHQSYGPYAKGQWAGVDQSVWSDKGWGKGKGPAVWGKGGFVPSNHSVVPSADQGWERAVWGWHDEEADAIGASDWSGWGGYCEMTNAKGKGKHDSGKGELRNGKEPCQPDTEQDPETTVNPEDEDWSKYSLLGGPSKHAITVANRAQLVNMLLDDKITTGTLTTWQGVTFDAFFWLFGGFDAAQTNLKAMCRNGVTPKNLVAELKKTHDEFHRSPDAPTEALATVITRCRDKEGILKMALDAGLPQEDKPAEKARTDYRGHEGKGGYGSRYASDAHMTRPSHKRELQATSPDENLEHLLKRTRLAEARTNAVKAEFEADKAEQLTKALANKVHSPTGTAVSPVSSQHMATPTSDTASATPRKHHSPANTNGSSMPGSPAGSTGQPLHIHSSQLGNVVKDTPGAPAGFQDTVTANLRHCAQKLAANPAAAVPSNEEDAAKRRIQARTKQILAEKLKVKQAEVELQREKKAAAAAAAEQKRQVDEEAAARVAAEAMEAEEQRKVQEARKAEESKQASAFAAAEEAAAAKAADAMEKEHQDESADEVKVEQASALAAAEEAAAKEAAAKEAAAAEAADALEKQLQVEKAAEEYEEDAAEIAADALEKQLQVEKAAEEAAAEEVKQASALAAAEEAAAAEAADAMEEEEDDEQQ